MGTDNKLDEHPDKMRGCHLSTWHKVVFFGETVSDDPDVLGTREAGIS